MVLDVKSSNNQDSFISAFVYETLAQIHDGQTHIGEYFCNIFQNLPIGISWGHLNHDKTDTIWTGCNDFSVKVVGFKNQLEFLETTTRNFPVKERISEVIASQDYDVVVNNKPLINHLDFWERKNGVTTVMSITKLPIYDSEGIASGLLIFGNDVTGLRQSVSKSVSHVMSQTLQDMPTLFKNEKNYYIVFHGNVSKLSIKQAMSLTCLSMGKTIKQIASLLNCSPRTIEDHINILKRKLGVYSTAELIDCFWDNPIRWF